MWVVNLQIEETKNGKAHIKNQRLEIAVEVKDMSFRQWVNFHLLKDEWPEWLRKFSSLKPKEQEEKRREWDNVTLASYWMEMAKVVHNFTTGGGLEEVLEINLLSPQFISQQMSEENFPDFASIEVLSRKIFTNLVRYKEQERTEFAHKGEHFIVPESEISKVGKYEQIVRLPHAKAGEVIEALQRAHIYGVKDDNNTFLIKDKRYYTDLAMVACICRRKLPNGELEKVPLGLDGFSTFINERMEFLADLPASIALDIGFFLLNFSKTSLNMATPKLPLRKRLQITKRRSKRTRKGKKR